MSEDIFHWVYVSRVAEELGLHELDSLLRRVQENNEKRGISGLLVHVDNRFMQILEGSCEEIETLSKTIVTDARHKDINTLRYEFKPYRDFAGWNTAYTLPEEGRQPESFLPSWDSLFSTAEPRNHADSFYLINGFLLNSGPDLHKK